MMAGIMSPPGAVRTVSTMARKPRNPVARSPLLRKGGVHRKSRSAERMRSKRELKDEAEAGMNRDPDRDAGTEADSAAGPHDSQRYRRGAPLEGFGSPRHGPENRLAEDGRPTRRPAASPRRGGAHGASFPEAGSGA